MTPQNVIDDVRVLINDTEVGNYRYSDDDLLKFVNEGIVRIAHLRPDLFSTFADVACTVSTVVQSAPTDSLRLMEVLQVVGGNAPYESDRITMDMHSPGWRTSTAGPTKVWMRHPRSPNMFFIYPPCPAGGQSLTLEYVKIPADHTISETIDELHDSYKPVLVDVTVFLAQSIDDEHIASGRAKLFFDSFMQALGIDRQSREITDTDDAAVTDDDKQPRRRNAAQ
jgi:hypothetical protein